MLWKNKCLMEKYTVFDSAHIFNLDNALNLCAFLGLNNLSKRNVQKKSLKPGKEFAHNLGKKCVPTFEVEIRFSKVISNPSHFTSHKRTSYDTVLKSLEFYKP